MQVCKPRRGVVWMAALAACAALARGQRARAQDPPPYLLGIYFRAVPGDGVEVLRVYPNTPAEHIGLEVGDVIVSVNGRAVTSTVDFRRAMNDSGGQVRLRVRDVRTGNLVYRSARLW
jgi:S1-C subfamily serine protease